jgi:hypothetical protein
METVLSTSREEHKWAARIIIRPGYFRDLRHHTSEWLGASNDFLEDRRTVDLLSQR